MTNTVVIWLFIPLGLSFLLAFLQRAPKWSKTLTLLSAGILFALAFLMPESLVIRIGSRQFIFSDSFETFGRVLVIGKENLSLIGGLYFCVFAWNLFASSLNTSQWFNALSMLIAALWVSTLAVQPFLYAAVIILLIAITSIPLLSPRGSKAGPGVLRYIIFQTIAMPLALLSAWMLSGIETAPSAGALIARAAVLVLSGFAIWSAIFPVHTWVPMVAEESHPWTVSFLLILMQSSLSIFLLYFLEHYAWLRNFPMLWDTFQWAGISMIVLASVMISFQNKVRRILAYVYLWEVGYALLAIGLAPFGGLNYLQLIFMPRMLGFLGLGYNIAKLEQLEPTFDSKISGLRGFYHRYPIISLGLITSLLSLAGLPILASFPAKRHLINLLPWSGYGMETWLSIGFAGMLIVTFRVIHSLINPGEQNQALVSLTPTMEDASTIVYNSVLIMLILLAGFFPGLFGEIFKGILAPFSRIFLLN